MNRSLPSLTFLFASLLATLTLTSAPTPAQAADTWQEPYPGVRYLQRTTSEPNRIHALVVDMCAPGISPRVTRAADKGITTSTFASRYGAQLAINGGFYNTANFGALGLTMGDGEHWPGTADDGLWGFIAFGQDNRMEISTPTDIVRTAPEWMHDIVSGRPLLVADGQVVQEPCTSHFCERHPRTAVGIDRTGRYLYKVVVDGRWSGTSRGMTRAELAQLMINLGADRALNLDGGGSTTMFIAGRGVVNRPSDGSERRVSNHLGLTAGGSVDYARCCIPQAVDGANGHFKDLPDAHWARSAAETLLDAGITSGCQQDPPLFCPGCDVSRAQAAVFLARALDLAPVTPAQPTYEDVGPAAFGYAEIEALTAAGMISGCSQTPRRFCPGDGLTRAQAAVLLVRAMGAEPLPATTPTFTDTPVDAWYTPYVERLVDACIVSGCADNPRRYCPADTVTRAQFAALLVRALELGTFTNCLAGPAPGDDVGDDLPDAGGEFPDDTGHGTPDAFGRDTTEPAPGTPPGTDDPSRPNAGSTTVTSASSCASAPTGAPFPALGLPLALALVAASRLRRRRWRTTSPPGA